MQIDRPAYKSTPDVEGENLLKFFDLLRVQHHAELTLFAWVVKRDQWNTAVVFVKHNKIIAIYMWYNKIWFASFISVTAMMYFQLYVQTSV